MYSLTDWRLLAVISENGVKENIQNQHISKGTTFILEPVSVWREFTQITHNLGKLLVTKAMTRKLSVQHCKSPCDQFHTSDC